MTNVRDILNKLDELTQVRAAEALTRADYEERRAEILRIVQAELEALDAEFSPLLEAAAERVASLEEEIKQDVLEYGQSVKGGRFHAVYSRGRVSWDTKGLDRYATRHPDVLAFRKEGAPSIAIRTIKDGSQKSGVRSQE
jgi:hypothetical protein